MVCLRGNLARNSGATRATGLQTREAPHAYDRVGRERFVRGQSIDLTQAAVSQMEHRTDLYLSTLENFVEAMGGHLEIYAAFPDGRIKLTHASEEEVPPVN